MSDLDDALDFGDHDAEDSFDADDGLVAKGDTRFLTDLADVLRSAGLAVTEVTGWQTRARNSGPYESGEPSMIVMHHTASPVGWNGKRDVDFMLQTSPNRPVCNLYLDRSGTFWVCAAGGSNNAGKGGPLKGVLLDRMNRRSIGIEVGNDGVGEAWPAVQTEAYARGVAALCRAYGISVDHAVTHHEWAPTRKIDPAGPASWPGYKALPGASRTWDGTAWRDYIRSFDGAAVAGAPMGETQPAHDLGEAPGLPTVSPGDQGRWVVFLQAVLINKGLMKDSPDNRDGDYGTGTQGVVRRFQEARALPVTGIVDDATWAALV